MPTSQLEVQSPDLAVLLPNTGSQSAGNWPSGIAWRTLVAISVAADFLVMPLVPSFRGGLYHAILLFGMLGCTLAQGSLLATWLAWGDVPFGRRLLWHWIIAGILCCVWLAGLALAGPLSEFQDLGFTAALTVPIISLGAQFPLWAVRLLFGWRLVRLENAAAREEPFSIRDLMLATLVVAASFGIARLSPAARQEDEFRVAWFFFLTVAALFSLFAILPTAPLLLRTPTWGRAVRYGLTYAAVPIALLWLTIAIVRYFGLGNLPPAVLCIGLSCLVLSYAGTVILASAAARDRGYTLAWGRKQYL